MPDIFTFKINITQAHIDAGEPENCSRCPIALGILSAVENVVHVDVDCSEMIFITLPGYREAICFEPVPSDLDAVDTFIFNFDHLQKGLAKPFTFELQQTLKTRAERKRAVYQIEAGI